mgnify:CR=1 FL=1
MTLKQALKKNKARSRSIMQVRVEQSGLGVGLIDDSKLDGDESEQEQPQVKFDKEAPIVNIMKGKVGAVLESYSLVMKSNINIHIADGDGKQN